LGIPILVSVVKAVGLYELKLLRFFKSVKTGLVFAGFTL
jgi:hypothetical protein